MDEIKRKELEKFLRPSFGGIIAGGVFVVIGVAGAIAGAAAHPVGLLLFCLVFAAICAFKGVRNLMRWREFVQNESLVQEALADYTAGAFLGDNRICMGEKYAIGKAACVPYSYDRIAQVYEYVHKTNFSVDSRELKIRTKGGDLYTLCKLPERGISRDDMLKIFAFIKLKNNSVYLGYK